MKVLIDNYSSPISTEPMYFDACLKAVGVESTLWNRAAVNTYDMFDTVQPDLFITHINQLDNTTLKYLEFLGKHIDVVINITGATQAALDSMVGVLLSKSVKCAFLFNNQPVNRLVSTSIPLDTIYYGSDTFLNSEVKLPPPKLEAGIIAAHNGIADTFIREHKEKYQTYHTLVVGKNQLGFDASVSVVDMIPLYDKYEKIILVGDTISEVYNQIMFDAYTRNGNVEVSLRDNFFDQSIITSTATTARTKHTCWNRTARLLSKLNCTEPLTLANQIVDQLS